MLNEQEYEKDESIIFFNLSKICIQILIYLVLKIKLYFKILNKNCI